MNWKRDKFNFSSAGEFFRGFYGIQEFRIGVSKLQWDWIKKFMNRRCVTLF